MRSAIYSASHAWCTRAISRPKETDLPDRFGARRVVEHDGRLDGYCLYFRVTFDDKISFSTFPFEKRTHWGVPHFRVTSESCRKGDTLSYELTIPNVRIPNSWSLATSRA